jgi:phosphatidylglycerol:prolipoprotein diacylglycerol transferase
MLPVLQLGPWQFNTYSMMIALALIVGGMYSVHRLLQLAGPPGVIVRGLILTVLAGLGSTLLMYYLSNLYLVARYGALARTENMRIIWTLFGGGIVCILYCRRHRVSLGRILDVGAALPVPLGLAIGRVGCIAAGCCYGKPTDSWLGMYLPDEAGVWAVRYPTQLMSAVADLFIFIFLFNLERYTLRRVGNKRGWPFDGFLSLLFLALYSFKRVAVGVLRDNGPALLGPFTWMELVALASLVASVALLVWNFSRPAARPEAS